MLSNNCLCLRIAAALYVLLFLVLAVNSDQVEFYLVTQSYSSRHSWYMYTCICVFEYSQLSACVAALKLSVSPHSLNHEANQSGDPSQISWAI